MFLNTQIWRAKWRINYPLNKFLEFNERLRFLNNLKEN